MRPTNPSLRQTGALAAAVLFLTLAVPLAAQSAGDRIRVRTAAAPDEWQTGVVGAQTAESLWLGQQELPRESVLRLEVSGGRKSQFVKGLVIGTLSGAAVGLVLGQSMKREFDNGTTGGELIGDFGARASLIVGIGAGAFIGGLVGVNLKTERWRPVPMDRVRVAIYPTSHGALAIRIGASF